MNDIQRLAASVASIVDIHVTTQRQTGTSFSIRVAVQDDVDGLWSLEVLTRAANQHAAQVQIHAGNHPRSLEATLTGTVANCGALAAEIDGLLAVC